MKKATTIEDSDTYLAMRFTASLPAKILPLIAVLGVSLILLLMTAWYGIPKTLDIWGYVIIGSVIFCLSLIPLWVILFTEVLEIDELSICYKQQIANFTIYKKKFPIHKVNRWNGLQGKLAFCVISKQTTQKIELLQLKEQEQKQLLQRFVNFKDRQKELT